MLTSRACDLCEILDSRRPAVASTPIRRIHRMADRSLERNSRNGEREMTNRWALSAMAALFVAGSAATGLAQGHGPAGGQEHGPAGGMSASTVGTGAASVSPGSASG